MLQGSLFGETIPATEIGSGQLLPFDGEAFYRPDFIARDRANAYLERLLTEVPWHQEHINMYGKKHPIPRMTAWYGDAGATYTYSTIENDPLPWTALISEIRLGAQSLSGVKFNSVLLNLYRDGNDSVAWHADNEPELGREPVIASVSLGASRKFQMRHVEGGAGSKVEIILGHGSLLIMKGLSQQKWEHQVPKQRHVAGPRVNLTFRVISESNYRKSSLRRPRGSDRRA